jgi:STIP1 family protein 1
MASQRAVQLKDEGNRFFAEGDYTNAEACYSKAINTDGSNPLFYTNRALVRNKLNMFKGAISDCNESVRLQPHNMKAFYYRAQAELSLRDYMGALDDALKAYNLASKSGDKAWEKSMSSIVVLILKIKKERWEAREEKRLAERNRVRDKIIRLLDEDAARQKADLESARRGVNAHGSFMSESEDDSSMRLIEEEAQATIQVVKDTWNAAAPEEERVREVPEWMICDITFQIFHDPVMVRTISMIQLMTREELILTFDPDQDRKVLREGGDLGSSQALSD